MMQYDEHGMPYDSVAEQAVIGAMLTDATAIDRVQAVVQPDAFHVSVYSRLAAIIGKLHAQQRVVDAVTISGQLTATDSDIDTELLRACMQSVPDTDNVMEYVHILRDCAARRAMSKAAENIQSACCDANQDIEKIYADAEAAVASVTQTQETSQATIVDFVQEAMDSYTHAKTAKGGITGVATGFAELDQLTTGLQPGNYVVVGAESSIGKSAFALNIVAHHSLKKDGRTLFFSLEMSGKDLVSRLASIRGQVNAQDVRKGSLDAGKERDLLRAMEELKNGRIQLVEAAGMTVQELASRARHTMKTTPYTLLVIDYLQLLQTATKVSTREQAVADVSRVLQALAKELKIPIVTLCQLNRELRTRADKRPILSDIRESGAIAQDADLVLFLYRDEYYYEDGEKGTMEVSIAKQRNGPLGTFKLKWTPATQTLYNIAPSTPFDEPKAEPEQQTWQSQKTKQFYANYQSAGGAR